MSHRLKLNSNKKTGLQKNGRIRPLLLGVLLLIFGLLLDKWWWQLGMILIVALFAGGYYRYRSPH